jgi:enoyl-CoA hydratase
MALERTSAMPPVLIELRDDCAILTLNRPDKLNAITGAMIADLETGLDTADTKGARAVIITGSGRAFCAGSDISGEDTHGGDTLSFARARIGLMHALALRLQEMRLPSIAALNGLAYGGGLELALACTFRVAAADARLCMPEIRHGLVPSYGGTQLLPRLIGFGRALEMMLTGEAVPAEQARAMGLVTLVDDDPVSAALDLARRLPNGAGPAQQMIRQAVLWGWDIPLPEGLALERDLATAPALLDSARAGAAAFNGRKTEGNTD